jgi:hypothetical protein
VGNQDRSDFHIMFIYAARRITSCLRVFVYLAESHVS